ncbi:MAG TPA: deoxyribodipyrimidine photo-lyase [Thioalkalivibrio sp.]|nr:deoxyribodipyrimidine photo-lyase [Thioalkalivibrio sp.]
MTEAPRTAIVWFRQDLRLADNPALAHALARAERIIPVYIHAPQEQGEWPPGAASRWWLHESLVALDTQLQALGSRLILRFGPSRDALRGLLRETGAGLVCWNRLYEPAAIARDKALKAELRPHVEVTSFNAALLGEPWETVKGDGTPYRVFTPFWKTMNREGLPERRGPGPAPRALPPVDTALASLPVEDLGLQPVIDWAGGLRASWRPGEAGAWEALEAFMDEIAGYDEARDRPAMPGTSRLSPHLHFGEIGPVQVLHALTHHHGRDRPGVESYLRELGWREFAHHLLYHFPTTPTQPLDARFANFPWARDYEASLRAWQRGRTGIPIVDAGMRELWQTGWMHNRVRMLVASLLTKNLLVPWQEGARWFWDTLVDADLASNTLGWQWTAGCGADAAPYFRIFNPVTQGERFDPKGEYMRRFVPELAKLPDRYIHAPWLAPDHVLAAAGVRLGDNYPPSIVDLKTTRARALERFEEIKQRKE